MRRGPSPRATPPLALARVRVAEEVLRHLAELPYLSKDDIAPFDATQPGLVARLGVSQGGISKVLAQFEAGGLVETRRRHAEGLVLRVKTYQLTARGRLLAHQLARRRSEREGPRQGAASLGTAYGTRPGSGARQVPAPPMLEDQRSAAAATARARAAVE